MAKLFLANLIFLALACCSHQMLLGGYQKASISNPRLQNAAHYAVNRVSEGLNSMYALKLVKVEYAFYQIVAGVNYKIHFSAALTTCFKNKKHVLSECEWNLKGHNAFNCSSKVYVDLNGIHHVDMLQTKCKKSTGTRLLFSEFKQRYQKNYASLKEEETRYLIFLKNQKQIELLQKYEQGTATYGNTVHADLTRKEFESKYLGFKPSLATGTLKKAETPRVSLPASFDWRTKNAVTGVKNQGSCGSCWAFSTTGNIEGQWAIKKKSLVSLSEQELVDCDKVDLGCNGGLPSTAYKQIIKLGGLETETVYPYEGEGEKCAFSKSKVKVYINSSVALSHNETEMAQWLSQNGPISIGINAMAMQFYFGGVSHPFSFLCSPKTLDHGVLIVGYGVETTSILHRKLPFWIVKNSWGATWGERGYYRVYRGDGTCGLNQVPTSAVIN